MSRIAAGFLCLIGSVSASACDLGDAHEPGEDLGTFDVVASMTESTCGTGALGAPAVWEFEVKLVRDGTTLYWVNGPQYIPGTFASDGVTFSFTASNEVKITDPNPQRPRCIITRLDSAVGVLTEGEGDGDDATPSSFTGSLSYGYIAGKDDDCSHLVGVEGGFSALPCDIEYGLVANIPILEE